MLDCVTALRSGDRDRSRRDGCGPWHVGVSICVYPCVRINICVSMHIQAQLRRLDCQTAARPCAAPIELHSDERRIGALKRLRYACPGRCHRRVYARLRRAMGGAGAGIQGRQIVSFASLALGPGSRCARPGHEATHILIFSAPRSFFRQNATRSARHKAARLFDNRACAAAPGCAWIRTY